MSSKDALRRRLIALGPTLGALLAVATLVILLVLCFGGEGTQSVRPRVNKGSDFLAFWTGGVLLAGERAADLYDAAITVPLSKAIAPNPARYFAVYPPPLYNLTTLMQPLGFVNAARLWMLLIPLGSLTGAVWLVRTTPELGSDRLRLVGLLAFAPWATMALLTGQPGSLWLLAVVAAWGLLRGGKPVWAGLVLGWLCSKPSLGATAFAWMVFTRQWRAAGGFVLGGASLVLTSAALFGPEPWFAWIEWMRDGEVMRFRAAKARQLTLRSLWTRPFLNTSLDAPLGNVAMATGLLCAAWFGHVARRYRPDDARWIAPAAGALSATMLGLPYILEYDGGFHLPAFVGSLLLLRAVSRPRVGLVILAGAWLAPFLHPLTNPTNFSWGSLLMAIWLGWLVFAVRQREQAETPSVQAAPSKAASRTPA